MIRRSGEAGSLARDTRNRAVPAAKYRKAASSRRGRPESGHLVIGSGCVGSVRSGQNQSAPQGRPSTMSLAEETCRVPGSRRRASPSGSSCGPSGFSHPLQNTQNWAVRTGKNQKVTSSHRGRPESGHRAVGSDGIGLAEAAQDRSAPQGRPTITCLAVGMRWAPASPQVAFSSRSPGASPSPDRAQRNTRNQALRSLNDRKPASSRRGRPESMHLTVGSDGGDLVRAKAPLDIKRAAPALAGSPRACAGDSEMC
ncbi:MAG: hypothetical protein BWY85_00805 [Firmicutes bacterium ADurb.Bin506]|nr:MAG: hypothetical protein BWY85_00805 [Firmicutes bacterium ADurb.Bin506]